MMQGPVPTQTSPQRFFHMPRFQHNYQKNFNVHQYKQHLQQNQNIEFDGKRLRKAVIRKTVDYNSSVIKYLENRVWQRDYRDKRAIQPDVGYFTELLPCIGMIDNPINAVTTKFVRTSTNKMRCPIFCLCWTPEGRRLVTGASSGEFTLWNGLTFNFETILQAHDSPVRSMIWSHNDTWMMTGDHAGFVKYWQSNMNNVKMFQAHKEPLRGLSFCPTDTKFTTCSDDATVRIWDFLRCHEEKILRGHGADVRCVDWHPQKCLIASGSKDSQQPLKLWDPKSGHSLATLHAHKSTVMEVKWNQNGNWLLTASRDHLLKLFDIRCMKELQTFRGHKKEATSIAWHPIHESLFVSGGSDGSIMFWLVGADKEVGGMEQAHDSIVWSLAWHPLGHILCSGSNDHTSKFWTRNRPGDRMRDKYNLNTLPVGTSEDMLEYDDTTTSYTIPGMGLEPGLQDQLRQILNRSSENDEFGKTETIPGLDWEDEDDKKSKPQKKVPYSKPIPHQFQQQWAENKQPLLLAPPKVDDVASTPPQILPVPPLPPPPPVNMTLPPPSMPLPPFMSSHPQLPTPREPLSGLPGPRTLPPPPPLPNMNFRTIRPNVNQIPPNRPIIPSKGNNAPPVIVGSQSTRMPSSEGLLIPPPPLPNLNQMQRQNEESSSKFYPSSPQNVFRKNFEEKQQTDLNNPFGDADFRTMTIPPPQPLPPRSQSPEDRPASHGSSRSWDDAQKALTDFDERIPKAMNENYFEQETQNFRKDVIGRDRGSSESRDQGRNFMENNNFSQKSLEEQELEMPLSENFNARKRIWDDGPGSRGPPSQSWEERKGDSSVSQSSSHRQWNENLNEINNPRNQFRNVDDSHHGSNDWNENYEPDNDMGGSSHNNSYRGRSSHEYRGSHRGFGSQNKRNSGNSTRDQGKQGFNDEFLEKRSSGRGRGENRGGWGPRRRPRGGRRGSRGQ